LSKPEQKDIVTSNSYRRLTQRPRLMTWFLETRPQFLLLTPACFLVGAAAAYWDRGRLVPLSLFLAFVGALLGHVSVNVLNDVEDFLSGIDLHTRPTPFSGGSGFLVRGELSPEEVRRLGLVALGGTIPIGLYFIWRHGWGIIPLGMIGVALVLLYTREITRNPWICLVAPGLGFGPIMVLGAYFCQTGHYGTTAAAASLVPGFLVSDLLLLNQFPDVEADARGGRWNLPLHWGLQKTSRLYGVLILTPFAWVTIATAVGVFPLGSLLALLTLPLAYRAACEVPRNYEDLERLIPLMGLNVAVTLITPTLLALGIFLHRLL